LVYSRGVKGLLCKVRFFLKIATVCTPQKQSVKKSAPKDGWIVLS